jgi:hypothetical protein
MKTLKKITLAIFLLGAVMDLQAQELKPFEAQNGKWGLKDNYGTIKIAPVYEEVSYRCDTGESQFNADGTLAVRQNHKWGIINSKGEVLIPLVYDRIHAFREGLVCVAKGGELDTSGSYEKYKNSKFGFLDRAGKVIIPFQFDDVRYGCDYDGGFYEGLAAVSRDNKWGFIDKTGKVIIPIIYDEVGGFYDGKSPVTLNGREFYINKKGIEIME